MSPLLFQAAGCMVVVNSWCRCKLLAAVTRQEGTPAMLQELETFHKFRLRVIELEQATQARRAVSQEQLPVFPAQQLSRQDC